MYNEAEQLNVNHKTRKPTTATTTNSAWGQSKKQQTNISYIQSKHVLIQRKQWRFSINQINTLIKTKTKPKNLNEDFLNILTLFFKTHNIKSIKKQNRLKTVWLNRKSWITHKLATEVEDIQTQKSIHSPSLPIPPPPPPPLSLSLTHTHTNTCARAYTHTHFSHKE